MALSRSEESIYYRSFARVNLAAIEQNFDTLKKQLKNGEMAMAVVKADAYGHGCIPVAKRLEKKADYFGVACLEEALPMRAAGIETPILILSYTDPSQYSLLVENDITATLYNEEEARLLSCTAEKAGKRVKVHVAVDTGMGRIGFFPDEAGADAVKAISSLPGIELEGIFSHYACSDEEDKTDSNEQTALFDKFISLLEEKEVKIPIKHICNSAGTMELEKKYDMCRFGIALYGVYPSDEMKRDRFALSPAMSVFSRVVHVKSVPKGTKIGYGHTYQAPEEKKIATVSIGYADGFNRCLSGVGHVLIGGKRAPLVGRVCMDLIMVDVSEIEEVKVGQLVTVLGKDGEEEITAEELERLCNSLRYEVLCTFMPRVKRIYE